RRRTLRLSRARKPQRSVGCRASAAGGCSAGGLPHRAVYTVVVLLAGRLTTPYRAPAPLSDHLLRLKEGNRGGGQVERLCRLEIDDQVKLHGLLYRQVARLGAFENLVHEDGGAPH